MMQIDILDLDWDHVNEQHIREKHRISRDEVEAVCFGDPATLLVEETHSGRYRVMGPRQDGKVLVVILAPEGGGKFYPVTARPTKRQELRRYNEWKASKQP